MKSARIVDRASIEAKLQTETKTKESVVDHKINTQSIGLLYSVISDNSEEVI